MASPGDQVVVGSVAVEVTASARGFARSLRREIDRAFASVRDQLSRVLQDATKDLGPVKVQVEPEVDRDALQRAIAQPTKAVNLPVEASKEDAARAGVEASEVANRAARPVKLRTDVDHRYLARVVTQLTLVTAKLAGGLLLVGAIGSGVSAALAGITAAAAGLIPVIGQLVSVLVTAAGAAAALPGGIAIALSGIAALRIGSSGLGQALKELTSQTGGAAGAATNLGRQIERAARQVELAERRVAEAQRDALRAQQDLNRARAQAAENLQDLALALARARLDEEAAIWAVIDAERRLAAIRDDPTSTVEDIQRADLAYREALQTLAEVRDRLEDVTAEYEDAAAKGIENADAVVAARERERDAALRLEDAEYALREAKLDLAEAQAAAAAGAGGVGSALASLAPAAQELVRTLAALKPAWDELRMDVQQ
ncbi:MAG TPA: hypothetical protein VIL46_14025, partial [Gemmataceae bacterium]